MDGREDPRIDVYVSLEACRELCRATPFARSPPPDKETAVPFWLKVKMDSGPSNFFYSYTFSSLLVLHIAAGTPWQPRKSYDGCSRVAEERLLVPRLHCACCGTGPGFGKRGRSL